MRKRVIIEKRRLLRVLAATAVTILCSLSTFKAFAFDYIWVPDASLLKWQQTGDNYVYIRNLDSFDSAALGCCYNWRIDVTTAVGKVMWSTILLHMATKQGIQIGITSKTTAGSIIQIGIF